MIRARGAGRSARTAAGWAKRALAPAVLLAVAGCSSSTAINPSSFNLPGDISFACVRLEVPGSPAEMAPLADCAVQDDQNDPDTHSTIAMVTQVATGEVAAIDLRENLSLDSDPLVPGFTYVRVGEIPTGIATIDPSAMAPSVTFVSAFGSRTIEAIDTARFHPDVPDSTDYVPTHVDLPEGPTDVAFVPLAGDATRLGFVYAPLPASGEVVQVPVLLDGQLDVGHVDVIALDPAGALGPAVEAEVDPYQRLCPLDRDLRTASATPLPTVDLGAPRPVQLTVDAASSPPVLLVADEQVPVIHRFSIDASGATPLPGFDVGVPTTDVVVTPNVARHVDDDPLASPELIDQRYLYAIDATDGSVLAVDYTPGSATLGSVLAVNFGPLPADRIGFREPARTLEVLAPEYEMAFDPASEEPGLCKVTDADRADDATPAELRGVFLAIGFSGGGVGIVDVWDLEATCRGGASCQNPPLTDDIEVAIRRHRPRLATLSTTPPEVTGTPALSHETSPGQLNESGRPTSGAGPGLRAITCPGDSSDMLQGFPDPDSALGPLICLVNDPWAGANERWTATFNGPIPFTSGGDGRFVDAADPSQARFEATTASFCQAGVLGGDDVAASGLGPDDPELGYGGDQLEILGDLPPETKDTPECEVFDLEVNPDRDPIRFAIVAATDDALVLEELQSGPTFAAVRPCFPHATRYQVRTLGAYTVLGGDTGLRHRVFSDPSAGGACRIDTVGFPVDPSDPDSYYNFRALQDRTYVHPLVAFQITGAGEALDRPLGIDEEAQLVFDVGSYPFRLVIGGTSLTLIESIRFNPVDDYVYVVDQGAYQVGQIDTDTSTILRYFN
jgi:hypothetical protein